MNILYVTTFDLRLFKMCAKRMVESFIQNTEGFLLTCYEGNVDIPKHEKIIPQDISNDEFLIGWSEENADIIPVEYGGKNQDIKFKIGTVGQFNFRASRWFRKIVALNRALSLYNDYDAIVFIDADTVIINRLASEELRKIFGSSEAIYHLGEYRKRQPVVGASGVESGVVGFTGKDGKELLGRWVDKFKTGKFREYERWDDGYVLRKVVEESEDLNIRDLSGDTPSISVVDKGPFRKFIFHDKGKTTREIFNRGLF